jgi:hypothetical protein
VGGKILWLKKILGPNVKLNSELLYICGISYTLLKNPYRQLTVEEKVKKGARVIESKQLES